MKNKRKLILGLAFLAISGWLVTLGIYEKASLVGLTSTITAMAAGTFGLVWGNIQEHKIRNDQKAP